MVVVLSTNKWAEPFANPYFHKASITTTIQSATSYASALLEMPWITLKWQGTNGTSQDSFPKSHTKAYIKVLPP